jgi:choline dehydrogenase
MTAEYIIVGGGSSASVMTSRLIDAGHSVILIERGPARARGMRAFYLPMPAAWMRGIGGSPVVEMHTPVLQPHLDGRTPAIGQAAILGGGSAVNGMVYMRGQAQDYDDWDRMLGQGSGWSYRQMLPHFKGMEHNHRLGGEFHGTEGTLHVSDAGAVADLTESFILAAQSLGLPFNPDFNGAQQNGVGLMQFTTNKGRRCNAVDAFLAPLAGNPRLTIMTDTLVTRILIENGRAVGVVCQNGGKQIRLRAESEVLLAAGSFATPKLLMLSGLGPADHLQSHGIEVQVDLPGVGANLQDHHEVPIVAPTRRPMGYFGQDKGWPLIRNGLQYLMFKTGPATSIGVEACAFVDPDGSDRPTLQMYCIPTVYLDKDVNGVEPTHGITINACLLRPEARGTVRLASADPLAKPLIDNNYLGSPNDLRLEIAGLRYARDLLAAKPLDGLVGTEILPGPAATDDEALAAHCRRTVKTNWHPVGTARMGHPDDPDAVTDTRLQVRGVAGLRVIDCSAMPRVPSGNTNAPAMAFASRAAELILSPL